VYPITLQLQNIIVFANISFGKSSVINITTHLCLLIATKIWHWKFILLT